MGSLHVNDIEAIKSHYRHWRVWKQFCFERVAGSEAQNKLNLIIIKQLHIIRELDLLSEGEALNEENLSKARILHILVSKKLFFYIFCFCHIL